MVCKNIDGIEKTKAPRWHGEIAGGINESEFNDKRFVAAPTKDQFKRMKGQV
jgi:hypothetical protein